MFIKKCMSINLITLGVMAVLLDWNTPQLFSVINTHHFQIQFCPRSELLLSNEISPKRWLWELYTRLKMVNCTTDRLEN